METVTRAIIVAAGIGNRLRPVTEEMPKPLVKVNGVRMIDTSIRLLKQNGIHEICIVAGYKIEQFRDAYGADPDIRIIENPWYLKGNNITSIYAAREYLPGAFVIEGDLLVEDPTVYDPVIEKSAYCVNWMQDCPEWALKVEEGRIISCEIKGASDAYRNLGISMWTKEDGQLLAELVREQIEGKKEWNVYWDELPLSFYKDRFDVGIRPLPIGAVTEIDTLDELIERDSSYEAYRRNRT